MTENEALRELKLQSKVLKSRIQCNREIEEFVSTAVLEYRKDAVDMAIQALEEIKQYRVYKEIFESHFSQEALELLSDEVEFGKWLERGKWIAKRCDEINRELEAYRAIGTIDEFNALKEKKPKKQKSNKVIFSHDSYAYCPHCHHNVKLLWASHCDKCGGELDWKDRKLQAN